jgi:hypothetical protein
MSSAVRSPTERFSVDQWAATAFVVVVPIHALSVYVGFSLKPWFIPLIVGLIAAARPAIRAALSLPRAIQIGIVLMGVGGVLGILNSADRMAATRHLIAIGISVSVMLFVVTVKKIPYLGVAVRFGALMMSSAVVIEALLVMPRWVAVETLQKGNAFVGQLAEVAYGDIILVTGTHHDSNFSALYGAVFLFLVLAYPAERFFRRRGDGIVVGMLTVQLVLSLSKTGLLSLVVAVVTTTVMYRIVGGWRNVRPAIGVALLTFVSVSAVLLVTDATDGHHDIAHALRKRGGQVLIEADQAIGLATGGVVQADSRAAIWRRYTQDFLDYPITGTGLGTPTIGNPYAHNAPLESAGGSGVLGVSGLLLIWMSVGLALKRLVLEHPEGLPLVGAVGIALVASLFLSTNYEPIISLVFGLVLAPHLPRATVSDAAG